MTNGKTFEGWINPLAFIEVDDPWASQMNVAPDLEAVLRYLCIPGVKADIDSLINRYREISRESKRLFAAPADKQILTKLVWPLRQAKGCYMLGNYLGTISLCGTVAEMVAILIFEINNIVINGRPLDRASEVGLFGSRFERLGQERRIQILRTYDLINDELKTNFDIVRNKRRHHLHLLSHDQGQLAPDAMEIFLAAVNIVVNLIGQDIREGKLIFKPAMMRYLEKKGIIKPHKKDESEK